VFHYIAFGEVKFYSEGVMRKADVNCLVYDRTVICRTGCSVYLCPFW
jgi:hypothetical protein